LSLLFGLSAPVGACLVVLVVPVAFATLRALSVRTWLGA